MMTTALLVVTLFAALAPLGVKKPGTMTALSIGFSTIVLALGLLVGVPPLLGQPAVVEGLWYVDALSGIFVVLVALVQWSASLASRSYLMHEVAEGVVDATHVRRYYMLMALFVLTMFTTVVSDNLGVLWIALEGATLATTFLVAFYGRPASLEAAWKYLIICSTGIALGFMALLVLYVAVTGQGAVTGLAALQWTTLMQAGGLPADMLRVVFALALIGYGTKMGLAPMHTWLPDAYGNTPAPITALLSGALSNVALFTLLRYKALVDLSLGSSLYADGLLIFFGVLTLLVAAAFILTQGDYKRLFAYSSIEHMGFAVFSIGLGALGVVAAVIELVGHALAKSMLFFGAGNVRLRYKSTKFARVSGVYRTLPYTGGLLIVGILALLAVPPSPLFMSEYFAIAAALPAHPYALSLALLSLVVILAGFARSLVPFLSGDAHADEEGVAVVVGERWNASHTAMTLHVVLLLALFAGLLSGTLLPVVERVAALIT